MDASVKISEEATGIRTGRWMVTQVAWVDAPTAAEAVAKVYEQNSHDDEVIAVQGWDPEG